MFPYSHFAPLFSFVYPPLSILLFFVAGCIESFFFFFPLYTFFSPNTSAPSHTRRLTMSEERSHPPSYPEHLPELSDSHDWAVCGSLQFSPTGVPGYTDPIPAPENPFELTAGDQSRHGKLPIPRTTHPSTWISSGRVSRACENCREQKAKCSGHRPCHRCQDAGIPCSYGDRKREKMVKCVLFAKIPGVRLTDYVYLDS